MKINCLINDKRIDDPINLNNLEIEVNYETDNVSNTISTTKLEVGVGNESDGYSEIKQYLNNGLLGTTGVETGLPFKIVIDNEKGTTYNLLNGYLDCWGAEYANGVVKVDAFQFDTIDLLLDNVDSFTFEYLYSIGKITDADFISVPYVIERKQNWLEIVTTLISTYVIVSQIKTELQLLIEYIASISNIFAVDVIVRIILRITYLIALMVTLVSLLLQIINLLIQPVKYHSAMSVLKMMQKGCEHLGIQFRSSILEQYPFNKMFVIPEKYQLNETTSIKYLVGNLVANSSGEIGFFKGTFGDLLRAMKLMFNAKILIYDGFLFFEKYNFTIASPKYQLPETLNNKFEFSLNKDEFNSNYELSFDYDLQDRHTIQEWKGTNYQVITTSKNLIDRRLRLTKNLKTIQIPFALGKKKTKLNAIEEIVNVFYKTVGVVVDVLVATCNGVIFVINQIIDAINSLADLLSFFGLNLNINIPNLPKLDFPNFKNNIENRIGMLKMENDFVTKPKIVILDTINEVSKNNKIGTDNDNYLNAKYLYDNFHNMTNFVPNARGEHYQYLIKQFTNIPFTFADYENVRLNSLIYDYDGTEARLLTLKFNPIKQTASGTYKVNRQYITNLEQTFIEPDGK